MDPISVEHQEEGMTKQEYLDNRGKLVLIEGDREGERYSALIPPLDKLRGTTLVDFMYVHEHNLETGLFSDSGPVVRHALLETPPNSEHYGNYPLHRIRLASTQ